MKGKIMAQAKQCPICKWPVKRSKKCPCCGWLLESEELVLSEPSVLQEFEEKMAQARKQWEEATADYSSGRLGYGEEAIDRLRKRLKEKGFNPGRALSTWALAHAPVPSGKTRRRKGGKRETLAQATEPSMSYTFPASQTKEKAEELDLLLFLLIVIALVLPATCAIIVLIGNILYGLH
jgi:hypothetical protein